MNRVAAAQTAHTRDDEPQVESRDRGDVQVEPEGETEVGENESTAHEEADAGTDGDVNFQRPTDRGGGTQGRVEKRRSRERGGAIAHMRSKSGVEEDNRRASREGSYTNP
jgi:hypothetical protein